MKKVKITVLRSTFNEDLARDYGMPGLKPCSLMKEGQVFYAGLGKPEGFCDGAWRTIHPYVFALANGAISISMIGYASRVLRLLVAMTGCVQSFSSWRQPTKRLNLLLYDNQQNSIRQ